MLLARRVLPLVAASLISSLVAGCDSRSATEAQKPAPAPPAPAPAPSSPVPAGWKYKLDATSVTAPHGMVVSDAPIATHVGAQILAGGGNATDAAVATAFALAVCYPEAGNLGGGGFAVIHAKDGSNDAVDFRETAPGKASRDMYLDKDGKPTMDSIMGHRASGVPGSPAGLYELHKKYGKLKWAEVLAPAIKLAEEGFPVDQRLKKSIEEQAARLAKFPASAALFLPNGSSPAVGATFKNPELAAVLKRLADKGPPGFYEGETAKLIVDEMAKGEGLITLEDLKGYQAKWRKPLEADYRKHRLITMPPPSSGGIAVIEIAKILEGYDLKKLGFHTPEHLHLLAEAERRAFADRNAYLGDPDFVKNPTELLTDDYIAKRRATIDPKKATPSTEVKAGLTEGNHTTHLGVVDRDGNAVALTFTINALYGSAVTVTGAGFLLNDEMDDFAAKPGSPNLFGLVQGESNAIQPGKRPLSSMSPTIVLAADGSVRMVAGARGGPRIISATWQEISNVIDFDMSVSAAVDAPRIHHQHLPDVLMYEDGGLTDPEQQALKDMGYTLKAEPNVAVGPAILHVGDSWTGIADPRRGGGAEGY